VVTSEVRRVFYPPLPPVSKGPAKQTEQWILLGQRDVDAKMDRDVIWVRPNSGRYSRLRLQVLRHDIDLRSLVIQYGNGQSETWDVGRRVRDEERGPEFDLKGGDRIITQITMTYRSLNPLSQGGVQVFGLRR
jgi:hypothetical protein